MKRSTVKIFAVAFVGLGFGGLAYLLTHVHDPLGDFVDDISSFRPQLSSFHNSALEVRDVWVEYELRNEPVVQVEPFDYSGDAEFETYENENTGIRILSAVWEQDGDYHIFVYAESQLLVFVKETRPSGAEGRWGTMYSTSTNIIWIHPALEQRFQRGFVPMPWYESPDRDHDDTELPKLDI